ncbi:Glutamine amidotransferase class-I [Amycolatopsis lurida]|uniref:CTP synthase (glutamine hydrolyzing) n=1 Tax=Amycolatopsis lurida NRRL 2430 TaxID=1460371 RepID=A0A2P2FWT7_AMYLU|nr:CTP synthase [Amycolatopsis lurida]KFU81189.1 CTP synthase [Amycolatopsis lurida NRRL 2430]SED54012.1 Glutamine amidotransferase class-I [Amycolatopsis lurida]
MTQKARVALVGDRSDGVRSHVRIPTLFARLAERDDLELDAYWIPTDAAGDLTGFDGVWLVPGSPYRSEAGAVETVRAARENGIPFLGTCAGFQHALLEFARNVCGLDGIGHAENAPDSPDRLIVPLACSLVGHEGAVHVTPGTLAARVLGVERSVERYHCSYGLDARHLDTLAANGVVFSGFDGDGDARIAELPEHPFFLATLFQPELAGDGTRPHPLVQAFARAAADHAKLSVHSGR